MGGRVFGLHMCERIAFCEKFGGARLGRVKEGVGRNKNKYFNETNGKMDRPNACLDCTGMSGLRFLQKVAKHGLGAVKQRRSAANQCVLVKKA